MALTKYKIGDLIKPVDERNYDGSITDFYGININKEFIPTVANTDNVNPHSYKVLRKNRFVFSGMQTGRDECIRIGLYTADEPVIVSPAYTTFEILNVNVVLAEYFFMIFLRKEMDRYGAFLSDSSVRANLDWERFCEIDVELPPFPVQEKVVAVYKSMSENQRAYECGLDDLKLTCDAYIENLRREMPSEAIGKYLELSEERNTDGIDADAVRGLATSKQLIATKADLDGVGLGGYKVMQPHSIAYVSDTSRRGNKISLAQNTTNETFLVSSISTVFNTKKDCLLPEYLMLFFSRSEFDRYTRFHSWGSARETFGWDDMQEVKIPIPNIKIQQSIVDIYNAYLTRREINEKLKKQIKDICPVLVKGAVGEGETRRKRQ
jgi:type I restriction enzyme S subunit